MFQRFLISSLSQNYTIGRVSIFGNFCFRANCAVCGAKFFLRAIPHFLRRDTQTRLRGFARFCAQILRRKTKFCGAKQNFCGGAANFFFAGHKNIIFLLDAKVNIFAGSKSKSFCGHKIRHSIKPY